MYKVKFKSYLAVTVAANDVVEALVLALHEINKNSAQIVKKQDCILIELI